MPYPVLTLHELYLGALEAEKRSNSNKVAGPSSALGLLASVAVDAPALLTSSTIVTAGVSTSTSESSVRKRPRSTSDSSTATPFERSTGMLSPKRRRLSPSPAPPGVHHKRVRALCNPDMRIPIGRAIGHDLNTQNGLADSDDESCDSDEELVQTKEGQMNRSRIQRIEALRSDSALFLFSRNNVWCNQGCGQIVALDSRHQYYLDAWKKHRKNCKGGVHPPIIVPKVCRKRSRNHLFDQWRKEWGKAHKGYRRASKSKSCKTFSCIALSDLEAEIFGR
ncbi:hypothetical protein BJ912DRAFT_975113 [Pholiota molesta]|nr:hypothetical protein BJ912DRAFT_975113 [Pholiota molesta]